VIGAADRKTHAERCPKGGGHVAGKGAKKAEPKKKGGKKK
jgi:hypothetical protein